MRAQDVMTESVVTVPVTADADEAWSMMQRHRIHHLVIKSGGSVVGLVSARDLSGRGAQARKGRTVGDYMASPAVTVERRETVRKVANLMRGRSIGSVVVTEGGRPVGIITVSDLLELIGSGGGRTAPQAERRGLHHRTPHRKTAAPTGKW